MGNLDYSEQTQSTGFHTASEGQNVAEHELVRYAWSDLNCISITCYMDIQQHTYTGHLKSWHTNSRRCAAQGSLGDPAANLKCRNYSNAWLSAT